MAVTTVTTSMAAGVNYTRVTDTSADWASVPNSTYFYDKADKLVHYKDSTGTVQEIFSGSGLTVGTTAVTSGTDGRVFFQAGGVVQQNGAFNWDNTNNRLGIGANATSPSAALNIRTNLTIANDVLTLQNGQYGNTIFRIRDNATASESTMGSFFITGLIHGGNSGVTRRLDLGGYGLGASFGDFGGNAVWENNQGNIGDGQGTSVIAVSSNFYVNLQTTKKYKFEAVTGNFGIGNVGTLGARLDVRAQGALSTDIAFRVRNSADTADLISFRGDGSQWIQSVPFIHAGTLTGGTNAAQSLFIGYNSVALGTSGTRSTIVGTGTGTSPAGNNQTGIGWGLNTGGWSSSIAIGAGATLTANNQCVMGSESYPFNLMQIGTGGLVQSAANVNNMLLSVGGVANGFTLNTDLSSKYFRIQSQGGSGTGNGAPIQFSVAPAGASGFSSNAFVIPFEVRGDGAGLNQYQTATPKVPSASITDGYIQYSNDITAGNAAPHFRTENGAIVKLYQETTAVTAAAFVANTSAIVDDTATFGGYTIGQVVAALKAQGLLA